MAGNIEYEVDRPTKRLPTSLPHIFVVAAPRFQFGLARTGAREGFVFTDLRFGGS